jgi:hypothetical protein
VICFFTRKKRRPQAIVAGRIVVLAAALSLPIGARLSIAVNIRAASSAVLSPPTHDRQCFIPARPPIMPREHRWAAGIPARQQKGRLAPAITRFNNPSNAANVSVAPCPYDRAPVPALGLLARAQTGGSGPSAAGRRCAGRHVVPTPMGSPRKARGRGPRARVPNKNWRRLPSKAMLVKRSFSLPFLAVRSAIRTRGGALVRPRERWRCGTFRVVGVWTQGQPDVGYIARRGFG